MVTLEEMQDKFIKLKAKKDTIQEQYNNNINLLESTKEYKLNLQKALLIFQEVAQITQKNLQLRISNLVTMALESVLDNPDAFVVDIVQRRNKTEVDLLFERNGKFMPPIGSSGGGVLDLTALALRIALWSLNKTLPFMLLDEPFKFLSENYQEKAAKVIKTLSDKLGIQFLIVSHQRDAVAYADKVFEVRNGRVFEI